MDHSGKISAVPAETQREGAEVKPGVAFGRRFAVLCGVLVAVIAAWNCRGVLEFQLLAWDDDINISLNPHLGPPTVSNLTWMLTDTTYMRRYVPLGWLGFSSVYAFSGLSPVGYHAANFALHVLNSTLLYALLVRGLRRWRRTPDEGWAIGCAGVGALMWTLHPFRAETIGWASGMLYGLSVCFGLTSVLIYLDESRSRVARTAMATLLYACSLLTYPITLGLVAVYFAIDALERGQACVGTVHPWWRDAVLRQRWLEKIPMIVVAVAAMTGTVLARYAPSSFWPDAPTLTELTALDRVMRGCYTWVYYLWKSAWPVGLTPAPTQLLVFSAFEMRALASAVGIVAITALLWRGRAALLLWLCYLAVMLPMLGLTEQQFFPCDRYAYLSSMVFSIAVAVALVRAQPGWRAKLLGLAIGLLGVLAVLQRTALPVWKDTDALYARIAARAEKADFVARTYFRWVRYHLQRGDVARAREVLALAMQNGVDSLWRGVIAVEIQDGAQGKTSVTPLAYLHMKFALDAARDRRVREATEHFQMALLLAPDFAAARYNYAIFSAIEGDAVLALHLYLRTSVHENGALSAAAKCRALALIARSFAAAQQPRPAWRAMELAVKEAESPVEATALQQELEKYRRAASGVRTD